MFLVNFQFCSLFIYSIGVFLFFPTVFNDIFSSPAGRNPAYPFGSVSNAHALHVSASAVRASNAFAFVFPLHFIYREKLLFPAATANIFSISAAPLLRPVPCIGVSAQFGRLQYIPDSPALFFFLRFLRRRAQLRPQFYRIIKNQRNIFRKIRAASAVEDNGFVFCSLCRRDVEISGLPYSLFPASLLIYVKKSISRVCR